MPSMDMGGKCCAGAAVLMRPSRDKKGVPVGGEALGPYGTPKCEFIMQLLRVEEPENESAGLGGVWIGAHPTIGEKIAQVCVCVCVCVCTRVCVCWRLSTCRNRGCSHRRLRLPSCVPSLQP